MGIVRHPLFFLPIHHYTYEIYYVRQKEHEEKEKEKCEDLYGKPFDKISDNLKRTLKNYWRWPLWKFNDIVGYLGAGNCLNIV